MKQVEVLKTKARYFNVADFFFLYINSLTLPVLDKGEFNINFGKINIFLKSKSA